MAESRQELLRSAWLEGKDGALSGREQAKAWALREMWRDAGKADHGTGVAMNIVSERERSARAGFRTHRPGEHEHIQAHTQILSETDH